MELIEKIISSVGGTVALAGATTWLATKLIENRFARSIEEYKSRLKAESDEQIESLKSHFQVAAKEREITASWLHQKRAAVIETLYSSLVDLQNSTRIVLDILSPNDPLDIRKCSTEAVTKLHNTYNAYLKAKIFLSNNTCDAIEKVLNGIQNPVIMYSLYLGNYEDNELSTLIDVKERAWKEILEVVPSALRELESDFRQVLGVELG